MQCFLHRLGENLMQDMSLLKSASDTTLGIDFSFRGSFIIVAGF